MNFYVTTENEDYLRNVFMNFRFFHLVSVSNLVQKLNTNYTELSLYQKWILNNDIKREIKKCLTKTNVFAILYHNPWLNYDSIKNLDNYLNSIEKINKIVLLDDKELKKNEEYYQFFKEVAFFPKIKKLKIDELNKLDRITNNY